MALIDNELIYWKTASSVVRGAGLQAPAAHENAAMYKVNVDEQLQAIVARVARRIAFYRDAPGDEPFSLINDELRANIKGFRRPQREFFLTGGFGAGSFVSGSVPVNPGGGQTPGGGGTLTAQEFYTLLAPMLEGGTNITLVEDAGQRRITFNVPSVAGPQGPAGPKGDKGDTGDTGAQGARGDKGDKGDPGAVGPQGPAGPQGNEGPQGDKGDKGDTGDQGAQGPAGPAGSDASVTKASVKAVIPRAGAFTAADETHLDSVEAGAQVNPKHVVSFNSLDNNGAVAGGIYFIKSDNTEWNSGPATDIAAIEIHPNQFALNLNPQSPVSIPADTSWHSLPDDMVENLGSTIWTFYNMGTGLVTNSPTFQIQAETIVKNSDGNYVLQNLHVLKDWTWSGSGGVNWRVAAVFAPPSGSDAIIGVVPKSTLPGDVVYREQLEGKETDRYASYNNAFVGNAYRAGDWVLSSDTAGPPTTPNLIRQPDITTGSGVIALGRLRTDADPNHLVWAPVPTADDYANGDVIYASLDRDKGSHLKITLTSAPTLVGTGDSAYLWATASWVETGNIANVAVAGDYFKLAAEEPTGLQIEIPASDVLGAPWLNVDGSNVTEDTKRAIQGRNETVTLQNDYTVGSSADYRVHITTASKQIVVRLPSSQVDSSDDVDLSRVLIGYAWINLDGWYVEVVANAVRSVIGSGLNFTFNYVEVDDTNIPQGTQPSVGTVLKPQVIGEDVHRGQLANVAFSGDYDDLSGTPDEPAKSGSTLDITSSWQNVGGPFEDDDIIAVGGEGAWSTETNNIALMPPFIGKFTDLSTSVRWWVTRDTSGGRRFGIRRNGQNVQVQTVHNVANGKAWAVKIA